MGQWSRLTAGCSEPRQTDGYRARARLFDATGWGRARRPFNPQSFSWGASVHLAVLARRHLPRVSGGESTGSRTRRVHAVSAPSPPGCAASGPGIFPAEARGRRGALQLEWLVSWRPDDRTENRLLSYAGSMALPMRSLLWWAADIGAHDTHCGTAVPASMG